MDEARRLEAELEQWLGPATDPAAEIEAELVNGAWRGHDGRFVSRPDRPTRMGGRVSYGPNHILNQAGVVPRLLARALSGNPNEALTAVRHLRWRIELLESEAVALAREMGWAWQDIGESLGLRRQTVHRRYAKALEPPRPRTRRSRGRGRG